MFVIFNDRAGMLVLPLAVPAVCPGFLIGVPGWGRWGRSVRGDLVGLVGRLGLAGRSRRGTGSSIRARGASLRAGAG
jgi:hypothetical protein